MLYKRDPNLPHGPGDNDRKPRNDRTILDHVGHDIKTRLLYMKYIINFFIFNNLEINL